MKTRNKGMGNREKGMGIILFAITSFLFPLPSSLSAAVPLKWTVETSRATPAQFEAYQGETLDLEATLQSYGKPVEMTGIAALYWQTNGMGSTYWEASAAVNSNRMSAVWTPEMDVGAKSYNCFIGQPGTIYHAAFQLRLRPSPGATPNVLPLPTPVIDFAKVRVLNPPWEGGGGGGVNTNAVIDIVNATIETNRTVGALADSVTYLASSVSGLQSSKLDGPTDPTLTISGKAADAKATGDALAAKRGMTDRAFVNPGSTFPFAIEKWVVRNSELEFVIRDPSYLRWEISTGDPYPWIDGEKTSDGWRFELWDVLDEPELLSSWSGSDITNASLDNGSVTPVIITDTLALSSEVPAPVDVIDPASATTTGKAADALKTKQALEGKRDLTNNVCNVNSFGSWTNKFDSSFTLVRNPFTPYDPDRAAWALYKNGSFYVNSRPSGSENDATLTFIAHDMWDGDYDLTFTRPVFSTAGKPYATFDLIPAPYTPSAADPTFSNAVVSVNLSLGHTRSAVLSAAADFYRTGRDGEVGTGWAYTAIEGTGEKRFAAEVPSFGTTIILTPSDADDPIVSAFGGRFNGTDLVREISFLGSASAPGRYDVAEADFSLTNGIPVVATVRRNILSPSPSLEGVRVTDTYTWLEFDTPDGVHHGCYNFYAVGSTVYYTDEWSTTSDWGVEDHSFEVSASDPCEAKYELVVFGSAGTLQTEEGVTDAVTDYIQNHSIRKEVLVERTGLDGELGDGWGYKIYDWTSEYRLWRLVVPRLDVTTTATAARTQDAQYYSIVGNYSQYPSNPMLDYGLAPGTVTEGVSVTHGKTSPDCCTSADLTYSAWRMPGSGSDVVSAIAAGLTYGSSQYGFEIRECAIPQSAVYEIDLYVPGYYSNVSNVFNCTMTNFRPSGSSVTYDNTVHCWSWRNGTLFTEGEFTTHPSFGFSSIRYSSSFKSVTANASRIADTVTAHYYWDPGMRCTFEIGVTNGCFFSRKVSDSNLTAGGN